MIDTVRRRVFLDEDGNLTLAAVGFTPSLWDSENWHNLLTEVLDIMDYGGHDLVGLVRDAWVLPEIVRATGPVEGVTMLHYGNVAVFVEEIARTKQGRLFLQQVRVYEYDEREDRWVSWETTPRDIDSLEFGEATFDQLYEEAARVYGWDDDDVFELRIPAAKLETDWEDIGDGGYEYGFAAEPTHRDLWPLQEMFAYD